MNNYYAKSKHARFCGYKGLSTRILIHSSTGQELEHCILCLPTTCHKQNKCKTAFNYSITLCNLAFSSEDAKQCRIASGSVEN